MPDGPSQNYDDGQISKQDDPFDRGRVPDQMVNLDWQEQSDGHDAQPFGPCSLPPEPVRLNQVEQRHGERQQGQPHKPTVIDMVYGFQEETRVSSVGLQMQLTYQMFRDFGKIAMYERQ
jgi:hypothetical protein